MFDIGRMLPIGLTIDYPRKQWQGAPVDQLSSLKMAIVAVNYGPGAAHLASRARRTGLDAFEEISSLLSASDQSRVDRAAEEMLEKGISATLIGDDHYPFMLASLKAAPPVLFFLGPVELLTEPAVGVCGSRNVSTEGMKAAAACGEVATDLRLTVVSGYARGVDMTSHTSALRSGGRTVIVLPEGILNFRVKRGDFASTWDPGRTLVVSQFPPQQTWTAGGAMRRNSVIIGLGRTLVVVEAGESGGTLAAGSQALDAGKRVIALEFADTPRGNAMLVRRGATPARDRTELYKRLSATEDEPGGHQLAIID